MAKKKTDDTALTGAHLADGSVVTEQPTERTDEEIITAMTVAGFEIHADPARMHDQARVLFAMLRVYHG